MISLTDYLFLTAIFTFLGVMPKDSGYKARTWLLIAEFCAFSGLYLMMEGYDPFWFYIFSAWLATVFALAFVLLQAKWLACLSGFMSVYHFSLGFAYYFKLDGYIDYYYYVMLAVCICQLLCVIPGVVYGVRRVLYRRFLNDRRNGSRLDFTN